MTTDDREPLRPARGEAPGERPAEPDDRDDEDERENPFGLFPVIVLLVLVVGGLFVAFTLHDVSNIQDCVSSGRKNCAPVER